MKRALYGAEVDEEQPRLPSRRDEKRRRDDAVQKNGKQEKRSQLKLVVDLALRLVALGLVSDISLSSSRVTPPTALIHLVIHP